MKRFNHASKRTKAHANIIFTIALITLVVWLYIDSISQGIGKGVILQGKKD
jgi:hypothetical protein